MTKSYQMNVKKGTRDLTWTQTIAGLTYGDANFTLSATSTNAGGITYASSDESIVEINGTSKTQHTLENGLYGTGILMMIKMVVPIQLMQPLVE